jgi:hypothetical protein
VLPVTRGASSRRALRCQGTLLVTRYVATSNGKSPGVLGSGTVTEYSRGAISRMVAGSMRYATRTSSAALPSSNERWRSTSRRGQAPWPGARDHQRERRARIAALLRRRDPKIQTRLKTVDLRLLRVEQRRERQDHREKSRAARRPS